MAASPTKKEKIRVSNRRRLYFIYNDKMKENFYPKSEEILFTNRETELETLEFYLEEFLNGIKENVCIFGLRRIGKTILIREFMKRHKEIKV